MEEWRQILYPLGFLSSICFGLRFIVQWLQSEREHRVVVPLSFWLLSLSGNLLLGLHSFIQIQFPVCLAQVCNGIIGWRNLDLTRPRQQQRSTTFTVGLMLAGMILITTLFYVMHKGQWIRVPLAPWQNSSIESSIVWHMVGTLSYALFSSRFWVQWFLAEKNHRTQLPPLFWWISLIGTFFSLAYFIRIGDTVNILGHAVGIVPYVRNLMLIARPRTASTAE